MNKKMLLLILAMTLLSSCESSTSTDTDKLTIYTSFYPVYDLVSRIAKEKAEVINLTPAGSEPHDYSLTTRQVTGMEQADLIIVNGLGLENWVDSLPTKFSDKIKTVSEGIDTQTVNGITDPHIWLNPLNAIKEMENITSYLVAIDNTNASYYQSNLSDATYLFNSLNDSFKKTTATFTNKHIVVSHAAFGYLCSQYGLDQIYVDGISPDDEPTAKALEAVISNVKEYQITTIFTEELVSTAIADKIAAETGCQVEMLNPLEGLSEDELEYEDYVSVMVDNISKLTKACEGSL